MGDIILGAPDDESIAEGFYQLPPLQLWDKPEIPYAIAEDLPNRDAVLQAMRHIEKKTGVHFVPYDTQPDAILFQDGAEHCESALGRTGGIQPIRLNEKCDWPEITHEILHALGFIHEQSRTDRDEFVAVQWDNIDEKYWPQFQKLDESFMGPVRDTAFDYQSILLYEPTAFAKEKTLTTLKSKTNQSIRPSPAGLSAGDILRVKKLFRLD